jgi:hypothetical protein
MAEYIKKFCEIMEPHMICREGVQNSKYKVDVKRFLLALFEQAFEGSTIADDCLRELTRSNSPEVMVLGELLCYVDSDCGTNTFTASSVVNRNCSFTSTDWALNMKAAAKKMEDSLTPLFEFARSYLSNLVISRKHIRTTC